MNTEQLTADQIKGFFPEIKEYMVGCIDENLVLDVDRYMRNMTANIPEEVKRECLGAAFMIFMGES